MLEEVKSAMAKAKDNMAWYYNQRRTPAPVYGPGDRVYLDASDIHTTRPSKKLSHRRLGPFPVERHVGMNAYQLMPAPTDPIAGRYIPPVLYPPRVIPYGLNAHSIWTESHSIWTRIHSIWTRIHSIWTGIHSIWNRIHSIWTITHSIWIPGGLLDNRNG